MRTCRRLLTAVSCAVLATLLSTGCGDDDGRNASEDAGAPAIGLAEVVDVISGFGGDSGPSSSPQELAARSGFVIEGTIVSLAPGRGLGAESAVMPTAVMAIRVGEVLNGRPPEAAGGLVYVESFVGTALSEVRSVEAVRVLVYAKDVADWPKEGVLQAADPRAGRPAGAPLAFVVHPDGLALTSDDGTVVRPLRSADREPGDLTAYRPDRSSWPSAPASGSAPSATTTAPEPTPPIATE